MILEPCRPTPEELAKILSTHRLFPDAWRTRPLELVGVMQSSVFWLLKGRTRVLGLIWLAGVVEGDSANLHILLDKRYRRYLRPKRRIQPKRVESAGAAKNECFEEILAYCFNDLGLRRITGLVPRGRKAAVRLCRNLGFEYEGCMKSASSLSGKVDDLMIWGYTSDRFAKTQERLA